MRWWCAMLCCNCRCACMRCVSPCASSSSVSMRCRRAPTKPLTARCHLHQGALLCLVSSLPAWLVVCLSDTHIYCSICVVHQCMPSHHTHSYVYSMRCIESKAFWCTVCRKPQHAPLCSSADHNRGRAFLCTSCFSHDVRISVLAAGRP